MQSDPILSIIPSLVLCQLWKYSIRYAGPNTVRNVYTQADVRKLAKEIDQVRLVLVHTAGLCNLVSWTIQTSALVLKLVRKNPPYSTA